MDAFGSGYLFGYLRRKAIDGAKEQAEDANAVQRFAAQRDALNEVIKVLVPEEDTRMSYVAPLYHKFLRKEYHKRNLPLPEWLVS
jgi:hypothetical protein